jgi:hypothetical protein
MVILIAAHLGLDGWAAIEIARDFQLRWDDSPWREDVQRALNNSEIDLALLRTHFRQQNRY